MLKKIAAVAAISLATALPALPAQAAIPTPHPAGCGWLRSGSVSLFYNNCGNRPVAVHFGIGFNPAVDMCVTVPAKTKQFIGDRAIPHYVADGACK